MTLAERARSYLARYALPTGSRLNESEGYVLIRELVEALKRAERVGYVCNGCEVPCRLDTSGKPFDVETAVCFVDAVRTGTDWKTVK